MFSLPGRWVNASQVSAVGALSKNVPLFTCTQMMRDLAASVFVLGLSLHTGRFQRLYGNKATQILQIKHGSSIPPFVEYQTLTIQARVWVCGPRDAISSRIPTFSFSSAVRMPPRSRRTPVVCSRSSPGRGMTGLSALESSKTTYSERRERSPPRAVSCSRAPPRDRGGFFVKSCEVERAQGGGNFAAFFWSLPPLRQKAKNVLLHEFSYPGY